jgi:hypothetical protein
VKGHRQRWGQLASPWGSAARGWAVPPCGEPGSWAPLCLIFGLREASVKIGGLAFVLSNSENISCVTFLKQKTAENRELALWHIVNRLVLENA